MTRYPVVGILRRQDRNTTSSLRTSSKPASQHQKKTVRFMPITTIVADEIVGEEDNFKVYINLSPLHLDQPWVDAYKTKSESLAYEHRFWAEIQVAVGAALNNRSLSKEVLAQAHCLLIVTLHTSSDDAGNDNGESQAKSWTSELQVMVPVH
ncbi:hypothetical protein BU25DRAFT_416873 [Macroventuria anomochaeta]|uniref:Uncharacterized protein n=1 Tax=Macroventuria anomochaeta TaxID=301207 RepID=A0ACB6SJ34_9PLEO|nr:uncharacterized protein BU25DRAFT_416873 [Macroventuria anomochaeta]KAF2633700.1 hypothetical protein BU25DRAFT_416873 [Macroventuria anomochaeta]